MSDPAHFACVVLPGDADSPAVAAAVEHALAAGADPVIVPLPLDAPRPSGAHVVTVNRGLPPISALRRAMAALANSPATGLVLWDTGIDSSSGVGRVVVDEARATSAPIVIPERDGMALTPVWYSREAWLELMTVGEQGLDAVQARYATRLVRIEVPRALA